MTDEMQTVVDGIAANLARLMRRRRVSVQRLAERSPIDHDRIEAFRVGAAEPRVDEIFLLAGALEVEPAVLLERIEWTPDGRGGGRFRVRDRGD